jgi:hypothetical protein
MITQSIEYRDLDGNPASRVLHFHISAAALADHLEMRDRLSELNDILTGPKRELQSGEVQKIVDVVKFFIDLSYGVRLGTDEFDQSPEALQKFKRSQAYSAFLLSLFKDPEKAVTFVLSVLPQDLASEMKGEDGETLEEMAKTHGIELPDNLKQPERLPPGTRIVNDVPVASAASTDGGDTPDFDEMLKQMDGDPNSGKTPITQEQADFMKERLKSDQFDKFMSTRYVKQDAPQAS